MKLCGLFITTEKNEKNRIALSVLKGIELHENLTNASLNPVIASLKRMVAFNSYSPKEINKMIEWLEALSKGNKNGINN